MAGKNLTKKIKKGDRYVCTDCGLTVVVDEPCGCIGFHELACCGKPMAPRRKQKKTRK